MIFDLVVMLFERVSGLVFDLLFVVGTTCCLFGFMLVLVVFVCFVW